MVEWKKWKVAERLKMKEKLREKLEERESESGELRVSYVKMKLVGIK